MYRNLIYRYPLRLIRHESLLNISEGKKCCLYENQLRHISLSVAWFKKRRPAEEKAIENHGRRVIRYSPKAASEVVGIWRNMTVRDIADVLNKDIDHVLKCLEFADKSSDTNYNEHTVIHNPQIVREVVKISGFRFKIVPPPNQEAEQEENKDAVPAPPAHPELLRPRPPVVCVMGHVDHGKTTLLDALRHTSVVDNEFGGITQHIGAFEVKLSNGDKVTFLDTPGHAAFSTMRARGARVTDLVVLVVAADDGVMEQTVESIRMAREADVPILVAINKIDKPGVNIERTLQALAQHGVVCEALGGGVQAVGVSARRGDGLPALVEAISLQAQLMELRAHHGGYVEGVVLESQLDPRTGKQATVLVQRGTLRRGCVLVAGNAWAKVRVLRSAEGAVVQAAGPAAPVAVLGWRVLPAAGDLVLEVSSEQRAGEVMRWRQAQRMRSRQEDEQQAVAAERARQRAHYAEQLARRRALGRFKLRPSGPREKMLRPDTHPALSLLVKGDVDGSVEAILDILETYDEHDRVKLDLVQYGVGPVTPSDLEIAEAFNAVVYAFNVECPPAVAKEAKNKGIIVKHHNVIYKLVDDLKQEISARIPVTQEEEIVGEANVLQQFWVSAGRRRAVVAGCRCVRGELRRDLRYRLLRDGQLLYDGPLSSMKHLKQEVGSVRRGGECGVRLDGDAEPRPGDTLLCYRTRPQAAASGWDPGF